MEESNWDTLPIVDVLVRTSAQYASFQFLQDDGYVTLDNIRLTYKVLNEIDKLPKESESLHLLTMKGVVRGEACKIFAVIKGVRLPNKTILITVADDAIILRPSQGNFYTGSVSHD